LTVKLRLTCATGKVKKKAKREVLIETQLESKKEFGCRDRNKETATTQIKLVQKKTKKEG